MHPTIEDAAEKNPEAILTASDGPVVFAVYNLKSSGKPIVYTTDDESWGTLLFNVVNASTEVINLTTASVLTVYLDSLLNDAEIGKIAVTSAEWTGGPVQDELGTHLKFQPAVAMTLLPSQQLTVEVTGALASGHATTGYFICYYSGFSGVPDGQDRVQGFRQAIPSSELPWPISFGWVPRAAYGNVGNTVYVTTWSPPPGISNSFVLQIENQSNSPIPLPPGSTPSIVVSFIAGDGALSLCSDEQLKLVDAAVAQSDPGTIWNIDIDKTGPLPIFTISPAPTNLQFLDTGGILAIAFSNLTTQLTPGYASSVFVQYAGHPTFQDGYTALALNKAAPVPYVEQFTVTSGGVPVTPNESIPYGEVAVSWSVFAAQSCSLQGIATAFQPNDSTTYVPQGPYPAATTCNLQAQVGSDLYDGAEISFTMQPPPAPTVSISASASNPVPGPHGVWNVNCSWNSTWATDVTVYRLDNMGVIGTGGSGNWGTTSMAPSPSQFRIVGTGPGGTTQQDCTAQIN